MLTAVRTDPFIFRQKVVASGYEWLEDAEGKSRLVAKAGAGSITTHLEIALFRKFALLEPSPAAIADFAAHYGNIFDVFPIEHFAQRSDGSCEPGASFRTWTENIADMRAVARLWEQIQTRQLPKLQNILQWSDKFVSYKFKTPLHLSDAFLAHKDIPGSGFEQLDPNEIVFPCRLALQREINKRLAEHPPVPTLAWTPDFEQRILLRPPHLLAALWLQFAQAVTGDLELVACEGCGKHFQRGPGARRADAVTCSPSCRQRKRRAKPGTGNV
ncbi:MAG: hypothetical protein ACRYGG_20665 [Janthinobacterium lividum]